MTKVIALASFLILSCGIRAEAQEWAKTKLEKSPRHLEWVDVKRDDRTLKCFIAYPESKKKATTVVVIHEIFGLSDWARDVCDELAAEGFIAIAPDLLSGKKGEQTSTFGSVDDVRKAVSGLPREQVSADLKAVADYAAKLPSSNGKLAVAGFCWGGSKTWLTVTSNPEMKAGFVFYGTPDVSDEEMAKITGPVYGFYGEKDNRVTSTVADATTKMEKASKIYKPTIYKDAGHGFMRTGEAPDADEPNKKARNEAWAAMIKELRAF